MKIEQRYRETWNDWMLPLSFVLPSTINFVFYYLGLALQENVAREYGFIIGNVLFAVGCGLSFLSVLKQRKLRLSALIPLSAVLLFYVVCYALWFHLFGTAGGLLEYGPQFIVFCIPAFFCGICTAVRHNERSFFENLERMTFWVLPGAIIYINGAVFRCNPYNWGRDFGIISYMGFAYTIMPFLLAHLIRFSDHEPFWLPFVKRFARRPQLVRGILIAVYWFAILASSTRGAYFCVSGFCILLVISRLIHKQPVKTAALTSFLMIGLLLFTMFVYTLPGLKGVSGMSEFVDGLKEGKLVTTRSEDSSVADHVDELVAAEGGKQVANRPAEEPPAEQPPVEEPPMEQPPAEQPPVEEPPMEQPPVEEPPAEEPGTDIAEENLQIGNRGTMFKIAIKEFLKSPITGMGPRGYGVKYGGYPHNVILELLCDTGLAGTLILMGLILLAIFKLIYVGWKRKEVRYVLLFLMAYAIQANISSTIWACPALLCALGYGLAMPLHQSEKNTSPLETVGEVQ